MKEGGSVSPLEQDKSQDNNLEGDNEDKGDSGGGWEKMMEPSRIGKKG